MVVSVHHQRYAKLRSVLKDVRKSSGLTQVQLAKRLQMEQSNLSKIERGETYLDTLLFIEYCRACGAVPAEVLAKIDEEGNLG